MTSVDGEPFVNGDFLGLLMVFLFWVSLGFFDARYIFLVLECFRCLGLGF